MTMVVTSDDMDLTEPVSLRHATISALENLVLLEMSVVDSSQKTVGLLGKAEEIIIVNGRSCKSPDS